MDRNDTELLEIALARQARHGNLVLRFPVQINGIVYAPAIYILQHIGPPPEAAASHEHVPGA